MTRYLLTPSSTSPPISPSCAAARIPRNWWRRRRRFELAAIAVTDRNTLAGAVRAHLAANEAGIKFVVGVRLELEDAPSLLAYPRDRAAYGRLCRLLTLGQRRAEKGECTLYLADVAAHADGLIFVVLPPDDWVHPSRRRFAPPQGEGSEVIAFSKPHAEERPKGTSRSMKSSSPEAVLTRLKTALHAPLYLAARHAYRGDDRARIAALAQLADRAGTPLVATGGVLYHAAHRRPLQDVLTCIREKCTINEAGFRLEANAERHIKSARETGAALQRARGCAGAHDRDCRSLHLLARRAEIRISRRAGARRARRRNRIWRI